MKALSVGLPGRLKSSVTPRMKAQRSSSQPSAGAKADRCDNMSRRAPGFTSAFAGRWRIIEMDEWDEIDLLGSAHITFSGRDGGELAFIAIEADLDVRYVQCFHEALCLGIIVWIAPPSHRSDEPMSARIAHQSDLISLGVPR